MDKGREVLINVCLLPQRASAPSLSAQRPLRWAQSTCPQGLGPGRPALHAAGALGRVLPAPRCTPCSPPLKERRFPAVLLLWGGLFKGSCHGGDSHTHPGRCRLRGRELEDSRWPQTPGDAPSSSMLVPTTSVQMSPDHVGHTLLVTAGSSPASIRVTVAV